MFYVKKLNRLPLYQNSTILDMCTSFFPSEIILILLNEYGIRKFLVRFQFSEQIFTYGTEMVRPVFFDEENVLSSLNKFPNKSMQ